MATRKQLLLGAGANLGAIATGMTVGFPAVALPALQSLDHDPVVTDEEASWIASLTAFGVPAGALFIGPLLEKFGRRRTLLYVNMPAVIGWLIIVTSFQPIFITQLFLGRLLTGLAAGIVSTPAVVYCGEVLEKGLRGVVVTWPSVGVSMGMLLVYMLGAILKDNWRMVAGISAAVPIVSVLAIWFLVPESPVWLASRGRLEEAEATMRAIRNLGPTDRLPEEMQEELDNILKTKNNSDSEHKDSWMDTFRFLKKPEAYKPLFIMNCFFFFQQFSGILVVMTYTVNIVEDIGVQFDGYVATVMIGVTRFAMSLVISYASKSYGRRLLCNFSGIGMTLSMTALAVFMSLTRDGIIGRGEISWFPITTLVIFILTGTIGFYNLPFAMLGEVFPARIRGSAVGISTCMAGIYCFVAIKIFPGLKDVFEYHNVFTFYAVICLIGTITMYKFLPETHGKTLQEVEESFRDGSKKKLLHLNGTKDIDSL